MLPPSLPAVLMKMTDEEAGRSAERARRRHAQTAAAARSETGVMARLRSFRRGRRAGSKVASRPV
jgi:hypothetical protein